MRVFATVRTHACARGCAGITFVATRYTYMDAHGVPSAGDWALDRNGAIFLQGRLHYTYQISTRCAQRKTKIPTERCATANTHKR